ncbi:uncharacterized protein DNG_03427 [Cephalotrichum gorgonifer]|uniref:Ilp is an apoptosis inhibitor n=1 Tax=Cephalotrichum gorgonifer TaxID=2041049 RepID=A0AAE8MU91_9PEZI|nr:uncharacterized protein DNG_03427 [Cephalotrichum gorgonifer]
MTPSSEFGYSVPEGMPESEFDVIEWYAKFQSCTRYFLDQGQFSGGVQAIAAFTNIHLPFQSPGHPVLSSAIVNAPLADLPPAPASHTQAQTESAIPARAPVAAATVTLVPYIRRLVATGFDFPSVLQGFFGRDWLEGIGPIHDSERRNYLFAAKSDNWLKVKASYDMADGQFVPFLKPLQRVTEEEIQGAEATWSEWLAMQDWMLGPRAPAEIEGIRVKTEG